MSTDLSSRTWAYRQSCNGAELKFSTTAYENGTYYSLRISSKGAHQAFDLDEDAIARLAAAIAAIEEDRSRIAEFGITRDLSLICEPKRLEFVNCEARYKFGSLDDLLRLWDKIHESALVARMFN